MLFAENVKLACLKKSEVPFYPCSQRIAYVKNGCEKDVYPVEMYFK